MSLVCFSEDLKRKSASDSSSPSSSTVRAPAASYDGSLRLNDDYKSKREHLFTVMPQNPHYKPLNKYLTADIREGIKDYIEQLSELDEMGYDCTKMRERFDALRALYEKEERLRVNLKDAISDRRNKEVKANITRDRISELTDELKKCKDASKTQLEELETTKLTERMSCIEEEMISHEFRSAAAQPW